MIISFLLMGMLTIVVLRNKQMMAEQPVQLRIDANKSYPRRYY